jgi:DNA-binding winged helix-turn-helix (wHTH) protein
VDQKNPFLEVRKPDGGQYTLYLKELLKQKADQQRLTFGRDDDNDIVLPDPDRTISRHHGAIEQANGCWWLIDEGSANGTFLRRQSGSAGTDLDVRSGGMVPLRDGDVILILARLSESDQPIFWKLTFRDVNDTVTVLPPPADLEYSLSQQQLFRMTQRQRQVVHLSPQERKLLHYMAQCNQANQGHPSFCTGEELVQAVWSETFGHTSNEVNRLVWALRKKIERDSGEPRFLKTVQGQGYLLDIKVVN